MADIQRTIAAKLKVTGEGVEILGKSADEIEKIDKAAGVANRSADALGKAMESANKAIETSSPRAGAAVEKLRASIDAEKAAVAEAQRVGIIVTPEQLALLGKVEAEYDRLAQAAGRVRVASQQAKRDLDDAAESAGGLAPRISGLDDIVREIAEDLGAGAVKWLSWGTAAAGALTAGYAAGTKLKGVLDEISDGEFSSNMAASLAPLANLVAGVDEAADSVDHLADQLHTLKINGIDTTGLSADQARAKFNEWSKGMREAAAAAAVAEKALAAMGVATKASLDSQSAELSKLIKRFAEDNKQLSAVDLAGIFGPKITELIEGYKRLKLAADPEIKGIAEGWRLAGLAAKQSAEQQVAAAGMIPEKLKAAKGAVQELVDAYRAAGERIPFILAAQADAAGVLVSALERVRPAVDMMTGGVEGGAAGLKVLNAEMEASASASAKLVAAAQKVKDALEGVGSAAKLAAGEVAGVFLGTPQAAGAEENQVGYDPLHIDN